MQHAPMYDYAVAGREQSLENGCLWDTVCQAVGIPPRSTGIAITCHVIPTTRVGIPTEFALPRIFSRNLQDFPRQLITDPNEEKQGTTHFEFTTTKGSGRWREGKRTRWCVVVAVRGPTSTWKEIYCIRGSCSSKGECGLK